MSRETKVPSIPLPSDGNVVQALQAIKSGLDVREGRLGDPLDQFVSLRDLNALGIVTTSGATTLTTVGGTGTLPVVPIIGSGFGPTSYNGATDLTTPPAPTGLTATATLTNVYLSWTAATYSNHAYTEIWRSDTNVLGNAVLVGTSIGSLYQDPVRENTTYYYWIRFVSVANVIGPYNSTNGTQVTTGQDPTRLLQILQGQIRETQLYQDLGARINLIDGPVNLVGSVSARINDEALARIAADTSLGSSITTLQSTTSTQATQITALTTRTTAAESSIVTLQSTTATQATQISGLTTRVGTAESNITTLQTTTATQATQISSISTTLGTKTRTFVQTDPPTSSGSYTLVLNDLWYDSDDGLKPYRWDGSAWVDLTDTRLLSAGSSINTLQTTTATQATQITSLDTRTSTAESNITTLQTTTSTQATQITGLTTRVGTAETSITNLQTTTASQATSISTLNSTVSGNSTSISTLTSTTNGLSGQYTVKIDSNGYVSGFGLASTPTNGTPTSSFIVRADSFAIASPSGPGVSPAIPFIVRTTPITINGETVPAGVYIDSTWIQNGTITTGMIVSLTADKITAGTITAAVDLQSPVVRSGTVAPGDAGFYLGNYGGVNQFYIGNGSTGVDGRSLRFTGSDVEVRGTIYAYAGEINNISAKRLTVYDDSNNVIFSSGATVSASTLNLPGTINNVPSGWLNSNVTLSGLGFSGATDATRNKVSYGATTPTSPAAGDVWVRNDLTPAKVSIYSGSAWVDAGNFTTDTNQLNDGASLGSTATWSGVSGSGKPADNATQNQIYRQSTAPTSGMSTNDLWFNTSTCATYYYSGSAWVLAGDRTSANTAAAIAGQGNFATVDKINTGNVSTLIDSGAIGNAYIGNFIQSTNFDGAIDGSGNITANGSVGWAIGKGGKAVFQDVYVRGNVEASTLKLNTSMVATSNINSNAVTASAAAITTSTTTVNYTSGEVTIFSADVDTGGQPLYLATVMNIYATGDTVEIRIYNNSTLVKTFSFVANFNTDLSSETRYPNASTNYYISSPGTGTRTIQVRARNNGNYAGGGSIGADSTFFIIGLKR